MASVPESGVSQDAPPQVTCIIAFSKGFICSGGAGTVHLFEKTEEKDFYKKAREIKIPVDTQSPDPQLLENQEIVNLTVSPSEETLVCSTKTSQLYCITMSTADLGKVKKKGQIETTVYSRENVFCLVMSVKQRKMPESPKESKIFRFQSDTPQTVYEVNFKLKQLTSNSTTIKLKALLF